MERGFLKHLLCVALLLPILSTQLVSPQTLSTLSETTANESACICTIGNCSSLSSSSQIICTRDNGSTFEMCCNNSDTISQLEICANKDGVCEGFTTTTASMVTTNSTTTIESTTKCPRFGFKILRDEDCSQSEDNFYYVVGGGGAFVVLIIILVIAICCCKRKKTCCCKADDVERGPNNRPPTKDEVDKKPSKVKRLKRQLTKPNDYTPSVESHPERVQEVVYDDLSDGTGRQVVYGNVGMSQAIYGNEEMVQSNELEERETAIDEEDQPIYGNEDVIKKNSEKREQPPDRQLSEENYMDMDISNQDSAANNIDDNQVNYEGPAIIQNISKTRNAKPVISPKPSAANPPEDQGNFIQELQKIAQKKREKTLKPMVPNRPDDIDTGETEYSDVTQPQFNFIPQAGPPVEDEYYADNIQHPEDYAAAQRQSHGAIYENLPLRK